MKNKLIQLFTLSAFLILSSCTDVIQIKLDEGSKIYVIDAFVTNTRQTQKIRVVTNDSYFSNREAPAVTNAAVVLKDLTSNKNYIFNYSSNGFYNYDIKLLDTIARINHQYELSVTIDGTIYTSLTVQKRTAGIDSIEPIFDDGTGGFGGNSLPYWNCLLWAKDKVDPQTDYYWIKTFRNDTLQNVNSLNVTIDGTGGPVTNLPVDSVNFTPPSIFLGFNRYKLNDKVNVEVHSIARETYLFFEQAENQINNGGLFATTPENVKTNIVTPKDAKTKAIGWFNMASVASKSIIIK
jgi:hypothetical protein